jgi:anti-anti-sigma factor
MKTQKACDDFPNVEIPESAGCYEAAVADYESYSFFCNIAFVCLPSSELDVLKIVPLEQYRRPEVELRLERHDRGNIAVLACKGRLTAGVSSLVFCEALQDAMRSHQCVLLDFTSVKEVDCGALGALASCLKMAREQRRVVRCCGASKMVREVLELTRLGKFMSFYESERLALEALRMCAA